MTPLRPRRRLRGEQGATLIEAAIITPLLLLLTLSVVDFAGLFYVYLSLENGVSQASRFAVTGNLMPSMTREESIRSAMRTATPTLTLADDAFSFTHRPAGSAAGAAWVAGPGGPDDIGRITVTYNWQLWTPLIRPFFPSGRIQMRVDSAMKNESRWQ